MHQKYVDFKSLMSHCDDPEYDCCYPREIRCNQAYSCNNTLLGTNPTCQYDIAFPWAWGACPSTDETGQGLCWADWETGECNGWWASNKVQAWHGRWVSDNIRGKGACSQSRAAKGQPSK
eukprot:TRINITY_DN66778_c0_g4_i4.p3 TRINITY_DN66778_c0_g4~~TRINITY_DN66778_c0_g4_i4.p3  ORF type:complete len:120 (-),score=9.00 TRINITY_DN66778_c0_g4_i4:72-431(-)